MQMQKWLKDIYIYIILPPKHYALYISYVGVFYVFRCFCLFLNDTGIILSILSDLMVSY